MKHFCITLLFLLFSVTINAGGPSPTGSPLEQSCIGVCLSKIESQNREYYLLVQDDGNLVLYGKARGILWATNTNGKGTGPYHLQSQEDGNLVLYDSKNAVLWASNTGNRKKQAKLALKNDGNLILSDSTNPDIIFWATGTNV